MFINKILWKRILLSFIFFYLFYLPRFTELFFQIKSQFVLVILFLVFACLRIPIILHQKIKKNSSSDIIVRWSGMIIILGIYCFIVSTLNHNPNRFIQNVFIVIWVLTLFWFKKFFMEKFFTNQQIFELVLFMGAIQGIICLLMACIPSFKNLAHQLAYLGEEENLFRNEKRLFGISWDYTFFTPCYHGFLASVCFFYSIAVNNKKFLFAVPFIFTATFLNNRTGIIIFVINILTLLFLSFSDHTLPTRIKRTIFRYSCILAALLCVAFLLIFAVNSKNFTYTTAGIRSIGNWLDSFKEQIYLPKGKALLWGNGEIQVTGTKIRYGLSLLHTSDSGYVNDLFLGGLIFCSLLYYINFRFIFSNSRKHIFGVRMNYFDIMILNTLLISNFKGQSMHSGFTLAAVLFIKLILLNHMEESNGRNFNLLNDSLQ